MTQLISPPSHKLCGIVFVFLFVTLISVLLSNHTIATLTHGRFSPISSHSQPTAAPDFQTLSISSLFEELREQFPFLNFNDAGRKFYNDTISNNTNSVNLPSSLKQQILDIFARKSHKNVLLRGITSMCEAVIDPAIFNNPALFIYDYDHRTTGIPPMIPAKCPANIELQVFYQTFYHAISVMRTPEVSVPLAKILCSLVYHQAQNVLSFPCSKQCYLMKQLFAEIAALPSGVSEYTDLKYDRLLFLAVQARITSMRGKTLLDCDDDVYQPPVRPAYTTSSNVLIPVSEETIDRIPDSQWRHCIHINDFFYKPKIRLHKVFPYCRLYNPRTRHPIDDFNILNDGTSPMSSLTPYTNDNPDAIHLSSNTSSRYPWININIPDELPKLQSHWAYDISLAQSGVFAGPIDRQSIGYHDTYQRVNSNFTHNRPPLWGICANFTNYVYFASEQHEKELQLLTPLLESIYLTIPRSSQCHTAFTKYLCSSVLLSCIDTPINIMDEKRSMFTPFFLPTPHYPQSTICGDYQIACSDFFPYLMKYLETSLALQVIPTQSNNPSVSRFTGRNAIISDVPIAQSLGSYTDVPSTDEYLSAEPSEKSIFMNHNLRLYSHVIAALLPQCRGTLKHHVQYQESCDGKFRHGTTAQIDGMMAIFTDSVLFSVWYPSYSGSLMSSPWRSVVAHWTTPQDPIFVSFWSEYARIMDEDYQKSPEFNNSLLSPDAGSTESSILPTSLFSLLAESLHTILATPTPTPKSSVSTVLSSDLISSPRLYPLSSSRLSSVICPYPLISIQAESQTIPRSISANQYQIRYVQTQQLSPVSLEFETTTKPYIYVNTPVDNHLKPYRRYQAPSTTNRVTETVSSQAIYAYSINQRLSPFTSPEEKPQPVENDTYLTQSTNIPNNVLTSSCAFPCVDFTLNSKLLTNTDYFYILFSAISSLSTIFLCLSYLMFPALRNTVDAVLQVVVSATLLSTTLFFGLLIRTSNAHLTGPKSNFGYVVSSVSQMCETSYLYSTQLNIQVEAAFILFSLLSVASWTSLVAFNVFRQVIISRSLEKMIKSIYWVVFRYIWGMAIPAVLSITPLILGHLGPSDLSLAIPFLHERKWAFSPYFFFVIPMYIYLTIIVGLILPPVIKLALTLDHLRKEDIAEKQRKKEEEEAHIAKLKERYKDQYPAKMRAHHYQRNLSRMKGQKWDDNTDLGDEKKVIKLMSKYEEIQQHILFQYKNVLILTISLTLTLFILTSLYVHFHVAKNDHYDSYYEYIDCVNSFNYYFLSVDSNETAHHPEVQLYCGKLPRSHPNRVQWVVLHLFVVLLGTIVWVSVGLSSFWYKLWILRLGNALNIKEWVYFGITTFPPDRRQQYLRQLEARKLKPWETLPHRTKLQVLQELLQINKYDKREMNRIIHWYDLYQAQTFGDFTTSSQLRFVPKIRRTMMSKRFKRHSTFFNPRIDGDEYMVSMLKQLKRDKDGRLINPDLFLDSNKDEFIKQSVLQQQQTRIRNKVCVRHGAIKFDPMLSIKIKQKDYDNILSLLDEYYHANINTILRQQQALLAEQEPTISSGPIIYHHEPSNPQTNTYLITAVNHDISMYIYRFQLLLKYIHTLKLYKMFLFIETQHSWRYADGSNLRKFRAMLRAGDDPQVSPNGVLSSEDIARLRKWKHAGIYFSMQSPYTLIRAQQARHFAMIQSEFIIGVATAKNCDCRDILADQKMMSKLITDLQQNRTALLSEYYCKNYFSLVRIGPSGRVHQSAQLLLNNSKNAELYRYYHALFVIMPILQYLRPEMAPKALKSSSKPQQNQLCITHKTPPPEIDSTNVIEPHHPPPQSNNVSSHHSHPSELSFTSSSPGSDSNPSSLRHSIGSRIRTPLRSLMQRVHSRSSRPSESMSSTSSGSSKRQGSADSQRDEKSDKNSQNDKTNSIPSSYGFSTDLGVVTEDEDFEHSQTPQPRRRASISLSLTSESYDSSNGPRSVTPPTQTRRTKDDHDTFVDGAITTKSSNLSAKNSENCQKSQSSQSSTSSQSLAPHNTKTSQTESASFEFTSTQSSSSDFTSTTESQSESGATTEDTSLKSAKSHETAPKLTRVSENDKKSNKNDSTPVKPSYNSPQVNSLNRNATSSRMSFIDAWISEIQTNQNLLGADSLLDPTNQDSESSSEYSSDDDSDYSNYASPSKIGKKGDKKSAFYKRYSLDQIRPEHRFSCTPPPPMCDEYREVPPIRSNENAVTNRPANEPQNQRSNLFPSEFDYHNYPNTQQNSHHWQQTAYNSGNSHPTPPQQSITPIKYVSPLRPFFSIKQLHDLQKNTNLIQRNIFTTLAILHKEAERQFSMEKDRLQRIYQTCEHVERIKSLSCGFGAEYTEEHRQLLEELAEKEDELLSKQKQLHQHKLLPTTATPRIRSVSASLYSTSASYQPSLYNIHRSTSGKHGPSTRLSSRRAKRILRGEYWAKDDLLFKSGFEINEFDHRTAPQLAGTTFEGFLKDLEAHHKYKTELHEKQVAYMQEFTTLRMAMENRNENPNNNDPIRKKIQILKSNGKRKTHSQSKQKKVDGEIDNDNHTFLKKTKKNVIIIEDDDLV